MRDYKWLHEFCLNRFGSAKVLEAMLPQPRSDAELRALSDDRYLSLISLRIFRAGLKHSLVDAKWPAFEEVFFGFDPEKVVLMGAERLENLMQDARLIRHLGKLKSVPRNAQFILDVRAVSYTHLDVYKRQGWMRASSPCCLCPKRYAIRRSGRASWSSRCRAKACRPRRNWPAR